MTWFIAKIVFKIETAAAVHFDERIHLISAGSQEEALLKARMMGVLEEETFFNAQGQPVNWEFINISDLHPVNPLCDGAELHSQTVQHQDHHDYIQFIHQRAAQLQRV
jgi:hypothetical protein